MDSLIETARKRFAKLTEILKAADDVREEWLELQDFLKSADRIQRRFDPEREDSALIMDHDDPVAPAPRSVTFRRVKNALAIADYVFAVHGPQLHVDDVLKLMLENGWTGSGERRKDYKNVHQLLASKPRLFRSLGKGKFERIEDATVSR